MALISCPECENTISDRALACPHCGCGFKNVSGRSVMFKGCMVVILIIAVALAINYLSPYLGKLAGEPDKDYKTEVFVTAQDDVRKLLKAPATAKFPSLYENKNFIKKGTDGIYTVTSYVDSENSFGANIRTPYIATYKVEDDLINLQNIQLIE